MPQKVLVITERYSPEPFIIGDLVNHLVSHKKKVTVLTQVPSYPDDKVYQGYENVFHIEQKDDWLKVIRVKTVLGYKKNILKKIANYFSFMIRACIALIRTGRNYDAVFIFHTGPLTQALPVLFVRGAKGRRVLWTQDIWPDTVYEFGFPKRGIFKVLVESFVRAIYRACDAIAVTSPGFKTAVSKHCRPITKIHYVPQWAPEDLLKNQPDHQTKPKETRVFRFAGAIGTMQNLKNVIVGFGMAHREDPSLSLEIYGDGAERQNLIEYVEGQGMKNVSFPGRRPMAEILPILNSSLGLILPLIGTGTVSKTIPAKFQAYLAAQRPIIAIMKGTVAELVSKHSLGVEADPTDTNSIKNAFLEISKMGSSEFETMAKNQKALLDSEFNKEKIFSKFVELINGGTEK